MVKIYRGSFLKWERLYGRPRIDVARHHQCWGFSSRDGSPFLCSRFRTLHHSFLFESFCINSSGCLATFLSWLRSALMVAFLVAGVKDKLPLRLFNRRQPPVCTKTFKCSNFGRLCATFLCRENWGFMLRFSRHCALNEVMLWVFWKVQHGENEQKRAPACLLASAFVLLIYGCL